METLKILTYPDKFLSEPTKPVENIDEKIQNLVKDMASIMYQAPGIGLAAIQVGVNKSLLVYDVSPRDEKRSLQVLINPRIVESEGTTISEDEGCLSVPDFRANVKRAASVLVEGFDNNEKPLRIEAEGLLAVLLQHEIDHLNGILFIDRISSLKRGMYKRRVIKNLKNK
ncbi:MAG: peptide deformylase [Deltaproteobacteria bacterium]|nr:peptide deformylase [Deltaproteobacteria bacterium]MBW1959170.1 peptide deformylase [Deltaproteobacteria bacterium]MBW2012692.1 peptide deformylase [Deltaproteobacteria bacterium]MBW2088154.1 peptide deformylase [Deltaproteobacteria bacterium]MBW2319881.1 peptide deformylase [Deltaproteobacteria bacterium]